MAGLKRILNVDKAPFQPTTSDYADYDTPYSPVVYGHSPSPMPSGPSPEPGLPSLPQMRSQTFLGIEKQFEELHDQFRLRHSASISSKRYKYVEGQPRPRNKRHVDVLEAIFSSQRRLVSTPITPTNNAYNEDIANRNIRSTSRTSRRSGSYSQFMSTMYQEDIADRNLLINGSNPPSRSVSRHGLGFKRSGRSEGGTWSGLRCQSEMANRTQASDEHHNSTLRVISSDHDLRDNQALESHHTGGHDQTGPADNTSLRSPSSTPVLSPSSAHNQRSAVQVHGTNSSEQESDTHVDFPPHTVRNECAKIPENENGTTSNAIQASEHKPANRTPLGESPGNRLLSPGAVKSVARKNIHALSVNTSLAAPRRNFVKVEREREREPAEPQVPTPRKDCASIAEVVNSPVPTAASTRASPSYNVEDMMNLFKKAYCPKEPTTTAHPTFETLQDAIVREINSHDAFRQVNSDSSTPIAPELSPDLTSDDCVETRAPAPEMSRPSSRISLRKQSSNDRQAKKLTRRKTRCTSEMQGRELSFPAIKGIEESGQASTSKKDKKRRHTYAQPPSLDLVESQDRSTHEQQQEGEGEENGYECPPPGRRDKAPKPSHNDSSTNTRRPHSSGVSVSKAMSALLDPTSDPSKAPQSHFIRPTSSRTKLTKTGSGPRKSESHDQLSRSQRGRGQQPHPPLEINAGHGGENQQQNLQVKKGRTKSTSQPPSSTLPPLPGNKRASSARPPTSNRASKTAAMPSAVKKNIPLRKSSIQKDLYDSGRFMM